MRPRSPRTRSPDRRHGRTHDRPYERSNAPGHLSPRVDRRPRYAPRTVSAPGRVDQSQRGGRVSPSVVALPFAGKVFFVQPALSSTDERERDALVDTIVAHGGTISKEAHPAIDIIIVCLPPRQTVYPLANGTVVLPLPPQAARVVHSAVRTAAVDHGALVARFATGRGWRRASVNVPASLGSELEAVLQREADRGRKEDEVVVVREKWVRACLSHGRFLGEKEDWAGCLVSHSHSFRTARVEVDTPQRRSVALASISSVEGGATSPVEPEAVHAPSNASACGVKEENASDKVELEGAWFEKSPNGSRKQARTLPQIGIKWTSNSWSRLKHDERGHDDFADGDDARQAAFKRARVDDHAITASPAESAEPLLCAEIQESQSGISNMAFDDSLEIDLSVETNFPLTFCLLGSEESCEPIALLITREGGTITCAKNAVFTLAAPGATISPQPTLVISSKWLFACIGADDILDPLPYSIEGTTEGQGAPSGSAQPAIASPARAVERASTVLNVHLPDTPASPSALSMTGRATPPTIARPRRSLWHEPKVYYLARSLYDGQDAKDAPRDPRLRPPPQVFGPAAGTPVHPLDPRRRHPHFVRPVVAGVLCTTAPPPPSAYPRLPTPESPLQQASAAPLAPSRPFALAPDLTPGAKPRLEVSRLSAPPRSASQSSLAAKGQDGSNGRRHATARAAVAAQSKPSAAPPPPVAPMRPALVTARRIVNAAPAARTYVPRLAPARRTSDSDFTCRFTQ